MNREIHLDPNIRDLFHTLRIEGNRAIHQFRTQHKEALDGLRLARTLTIWFHQAFGKQDTEARTFQQLAHENQLNDERKAFDARLRAMQTGLENRQPIQQQISENIQKATAQLSLNEELTRVLIDQQLISAG